MLYEVEINFGGFIGCSEIYTVDAESEDEARETALEEAVDDLYIETITEITEAEEGDDTNEM